MTAVATDIEVEEVLHRLLAAAAEMTGARYAALGILDEHRSGLERFVTHGVTEAERRAIGAPPHGAGLLGAVIANPHPVRVDAVRDHPASAGFPPGHPPMESFLGVPVMLHDEAWGNLYLCDKADGEPFTLADQDAVVALAEWAATAIDNARNLKESERRRVQLEGLVRRLEATTAIARALGGETDLNRILRLIVERGCGILEARGLVIFLREASGMVAAAEAGEVPAALRDPFGLAAAGGTLVPLLYHGRTLGMLVAFGAHSDPDDAALLQAFAASAATAVATARSVEEQRVHDAMDAAENERKRWARELHDDTLQGLGGLRMLLVAASRIDDPGRLHSAVRDAVVRIEGEIDSLRGLIRELRPAALDDLGLAAAIEGLVTRATEREAVDVHATVRLPPERYAPDLETAIYRIVQEALGNAIRHAHATRVAIAIGDDSGVVRLRVTDDGHGFDPERPADGFGLAGMRERVAMLRGDLEIASSADGTTVSAAIPAP
ncbi:GAF domain-containing sensor histidine kinase [Solirubrobacter soli]|uniref:GAF domain-containing sensor histidine kinase n=1 Tax=Solirubrobacter soli TaxID=363832 RepID=UPI00040833D0|nr:GAF domain-containing sensor histidine kinase [Solirubrobacter soli]